MDDLVEALTDPEFEDLQLLRWCQQNAPERLTPAAWENLAILEQRVQRFRRFQEIEHAKKWAAGLTKKQVAELERKTLDPDETLSYDECQQWAAIVTLSLTTSGAWDDAEWDRFYGSPLSEILFSRLPGNAPPLPAPQVLGRPREHAARRTRARRGSTSDGSDEPEPPLGRICHREPCNNPLPADPRARYCTPECGNAARQERHRRKNGAKERTKAVVVSRLRDLAPLDVTPWWSDCPACGVRNYTEPPNGVPSWHVPSACTACGAPLEREQEVAA